MQELLEKTVALINSYKLSDLESKDQHFIVNEKTIEDEIESAGLKKDDVVLDIGSGFGFLLERIAAKCRVIGIEKDLKLYSYLLNKYETLPNVSLLNGDVTEIILPSFNKVVSNPPYSIVDRILEKLYRLDFELGVMILPNTIAERLLEGDNRFAFIQKQFFDFQLVREVPADDFYPKPRITSKLIKFVRRRQDLIQAVLRKEIMTVKNAVSLSYQQLYGATKRRSKDSFRKLAMDIDDIKNKEIKRLDAGELKRLVKVLNKTA